MAVPRVLEKITAAIGEREGVSLMVAIVSSSTDQKGPMYYDNSGKIVTNYEKYVYPVEWCSLENTLQTLMRGRSGEIQLWQRFFPRQPFATLKVLRI